MQDKTLARKGDTKRDSHTSLAENHCGTSSSLQGSKVAAETALPLAEDIPSWRHEGHVDGVRLHEPLE